MMSSSTDESFTNSAKLFLLTMLQLGDFGTDLGITESCDTLGIVKNLPLYLILIHFDFQLITGFALSRNGIPKIVLTVSLSTSKRYYKYNSPNFKDVVV
jgi:hypothetical protein